MPFIPSFCFFPLTIFDINKIEGYNLFCQSFNKRYIFGIIQADCSHFKSCTRGSYDTMDIELFIMTQLGINEMTDAYSVNLLIIGTYLASYRLLAVPSSRARAVLPTRWI